MTSTTSNAFVVAVEGAELDGDEITISIRLSDSRTIPLRIPLQELNKCLDCVSPQFDPETGLQIHSTVQ